MTVTEAIAANPPLPLSGLRVGISGAIPEREHWGSVVDLDRIIQSFVSQLSGFVMEYGGAIVHGSHPGLTAVIAEQAREQQQRNSGNEGRAVVEPAAPSPLTLVASQLWGEFPEVTERAARRAGAQVILTPRVGNGDSTDPRTRNDSLTGMRVVMADQVDVLVTIGGKLHRDTGFNPGVLEELAITRWNGIPCFVVAGFGGLVGELDTAIIHQFSAENMLESSEVDKMAMWTQSGDSNVGILLTHLAHHREIFLSEGKRVPPRQIRLRPGPPVSGPARTQLAEIEPDLVRMTSDRFAQVKDAVEARDAARLGELLKTSPMS